MEDQKINCMHEEKRVRLNASPVVFDGSLTDQLPGWKFLASDSKNGMAYNPFEGYYPDKGGRLVSSPIQLDKPADAPAYYRIEFEAKAPSRAYQGIYFYDTDGHMLPDCYDVVYAGEKRTYNRIFYAMAKVAYIEVFFQSKTGMEAWNLKVSEATPQEASVYCDRVYSALPPVQFVPPMDAMLQLPRTRAALASGRPWKVVLLGDSNMQDIFHSLFHAKIKCEFPKSNFSWVISMRGSTGCWYYALVDQFKKYVYDEKPDLLIIGGVSNYRNSEIKECVSGHETMCIVARAAKEFLNCEVLFFTGALAVDTRKYDTEHPDAPLPAQKWDYAQDAHSMRSTNLDGLMKAANENNIPVWNLQFPSYEWLYATGQPHEFYSRDLAHSGEKGKQLLGRIVMDYFRTAKETPSVE